MVVSASLLSGEGRSPAGRPVYASGMSSVSSVKEPDTRGTTALTDRRGKRSDRSGHSI